MLKDRIQWEDIPDHIMEKWLKPYQLERWPFTMHDRHAMNREKVAQIYSEIHRFGEAQEGAEKEEIPASVRKRLPQDANLKTLYEILRKSRCAIFDDAKLKKTINNKETTQFKTCEIAVRDINRFIKSL